VRVYAVSRRDLDVIEAGVQPGLAKPLFGERSGDAPGRGGDVRARRVIQAVVGDDAP
jgi:hypothetical protein